MFGAEAARHRGGALWVSAALAAGMIAFAGELTCYYYCFMIAMARQYEKRREVGIALVGLAAATQVVAFGGCLPVARRRGVTDEDDL